MQAALSSSAQITRCRLIHRHATRKYGHEDIVIFWRPVVRGRVDSDVPAVTGPRGGPKDAQQWEGEQGLHDTWYRGYRDAIHAVMEVETEVYMFSKM